MSLFIQGSHGSFDLCFLWLFDIGASGASCLSSFKAGLGLKEGFVRTEAAAWTWRFCSPGRRGGPARLPPPAQRGPVLSDVAEVSIEIGWF